MYIIPDDSRACATYAYTYTYEYSRIDRFALDWHRSYAVRARSKFVTIVRRK